MTPACGRKACQIFCSKVVMPLIYHHVYILPPMNSAFTRTMQFWSSSPFLFKAGSDKMTAIFQCFTSNTSNNASDDNLKNGMFESQFTHFEFVTLKVKIHHTSQMWLSKYTKIQGGSCMDKTTSVSFWVPWWDNFVNTDATSTQN